MDISVLIDNRAGTSGLAWEHGLSLCFQSDGLLWLFDTGASGKFADNAEKTGINIGNIDNLILSHGHNDHTGGLRRFAEINRHAPIHLSCNIEGKRYFSCRKEKREIGMNPILFERLKPRFHFITESRMLTENTGIIVNHTHHYPTPSANRTLTVQEGNREQFDSFDHEISLIINHKKGWIVLSACSHAGILNILDSCRSFTGNGKIQAFIGGTHIADNFETDNEIRQIAETIKNEYPSLELYTGHCTGDHAVSVLSEILRSQFHLFNTGMKIHL
ncbi:MAG TPA: MBL fold metallo-hydrolase [Candidatus Avirikenella pullistercoris]|nr:MBL fold metallo-hydrolase [Candidatus Avirikenella pullistercoris]